MPNPWLIFLGMAAVTFFTRTTGIAAAGRTLPPGVHRWLNYVPIAVLAALIAPAALAPEGQFTFGASTLAMIAGVLAAWRTRNVFWTIAAGMVTFWLLKLVGMA
jgi:branched-subunit amino acid transport protein